MIIGIGFLILLFMMRNQYNWIAGGLREFLKIILISMTIIFVLVAIRSYLKSKSKKSILFGLIGVLPCLLAIPFFEAGTFQFNRLNEQEETIELQYIAWACECANWATLEDIKRYSRNDDDSLAQSCVFIEPANKSLELPDTLRYSADIIRFTGKFYEKKGFPKNYVSDQNPDMARVFRYTEYDVVRSNYKNYKTTMEENK